MPIMNSSKTLEVSYPAPLTTMAEEVGTIYYIYRCTQTSVYTRLSDDVMALQSNGGAFCHQV